MLLPLRDILKILTYLDKISKLRIILNLLLSVINSILESLSLSSSLIFFSVLFNGNISEIGFIKNYLPFLIDIPKSYFLILFIVIFSITGIIRIYYLRSTFFLSRYIANQLSSLAFLKILNQEYEYHLEKNTSLQVSTLTNDIGESDNSIAALLQIISSTLSLCSIIFTTLFVISGKFITFILFIPLIYALLYLSYSRKFKTNSKLISDLNGKIIDFTKDSLFSIRNILLSHDQQYYFQTFKRIDAQLKEAQAKNNFYSVYPRNAIEVFIVGSLASLFVIYPKLASPNLIPIFGSLIIAVQRIFPLFQQIYYGFSTIKSHESGVLKLKTLLTLKLVNNFHSSKLPLKLKTISFSNVSYIYPNSSKIILKNISLDIKSGDRIGVYGPSGSGKSTFINILMTLLSPTNGKIKINNRLLDPQRKRNIYPIYQDNISHIPQSIHLIDEDILANIVGPIDNASINQNKLNLALKVSNLKDFVDSLPDKINTRVGENGSLLSGGQKQRIGIAREIYKMKPILVLDEATNALDPVVEERIIKELFKLHHLQLIVIVSHKKSNLSDCNKMFTFNKGQISVKNQL
ncbi:MAG: ABC transporter ATP-binding protein [Prochlorococcus marinus CUG1431]|uniref:ABC transporter ATP-binding protein n=1 Tax=Prochlorococcus marinus CUG1433 TaxID=2774506 RepID=A0A9D9BVZ6_PROMR|nr:ABC transporter ATP-binding protein [Prochlorococcus marinus CUG1433]MBO6981207.1 ABC transporter ATP-binding protein [Prochlorococcus marinus CUG1431]